MITDEQLADALEKVLWRTEYERFRTLCTVDGTCQPWDQAGYQALMIRMAEDPAPTGHIEVPDALKLATPAARRHGLTSPPRCGCGGSCSPGPGRAA
jgi:hypothetical protein